MIETTRRPRLNLRARAWAALVAATATLSVPALALAQEFQKVDGKLGEEVPAGPFVGIAYGFIWIALLAYVLYIARGLGRVRGDLEELRRKLDAAGKR
jgi:CcmD family protein